MTRPHRRARCLLFALAACGGPDATADRGPRETEVWPAAPATPIDAGAPDADPLAWTPIGVPECDDMIAAYLACDSLPAVSREAFMKGARAWRRTIEVREDDEAREALARSCAVSWPGVKRVISEAGCDTGDPDPEADPDD